MFQCIRNRGKSVFLKNSIPIVCTVSYLGTIPTKRSRHGYLGLREKQPSSSEKKQLERVFNIFDKDKDGVISAADLKRTMNKFGKSPSDVDVDIMIEHASKPSDIKSHLKLSQFEDRLLNVSSIEDIDSFTDTARLLYLNEDFSSRMLHLHDATGFICDMDGVIYRGGALIDGVSRFLSWIKDEEKKFTFLTNNSKHTPKQLQLRLQKMGLYVDEDIFLTSAQTTANFLLQQKPYDGTCFIIGGEGLQQAMNDAGFTETDIEPDYVIIGESDSYNHHDICKATDLVHRGARLICTNPDVCDPIENGSIEPSGGAWVSVIEKATGKQAYFPGKPNPLMMRSALDKLNLHSSEAIMIGDRMETDVLSGIESNLHPVLVLSGVTKESDLKKFPYRPYLVLNDVGMIPPSEYVPKH